MTETEAAAAQGYGTVLLERAICYALGALSPVTPRALERPTPCAGWDLWTLLRHADESIAALYEAIDQGSVGPEPAPPSGPDPVAAFRSSAGRLLGAWTAAGERERVVTVAGCPIRAGVVAGVGAIEIAVHGWDAARACGNDAPMPEALAVRLLRLAPMIVPSDARADLFDPPVPVPASAPAGDRLLAFLGRQPDGA
ncbi:TIGR03086 family metal-binding protein [Spirillospora sp. CA-294931]|uniref:TIGR03086 family metal-binding protein n=1 Tax=Spirillospora sp. CA-294931 TaxID=3240042 RepID=UPI003D90E515